MRSLQVTNYLSVTSKPVRINNEENLDDLDLPSFKVDFDTNFSIVNNKTGINRTIDMPSSDIYRKCLWVGGIYRVCRKGKQKEL